MQLVLQVHDACTFEATGSIVEDGGKKVLRGEVANGLMQIIKDTFAKDVVLPQSEICAVEQRFVLPIDLKYAMRWSEL